MNKYCKLLSLSMTAVLIGGIGFTAVIPETAAASFTNYITRSGDTLKDGTAAFRFTGSNAPLLLRAWTDPDEITDAIRSAAESGIDVLRLYPFEVKMAADPEGTPRHVMGPGVYNEGAFKLFDKILQLANQYNVRLIVPFVDSYTYIGGTADWAAFRGLSSGSFWSDPTVKQDFKDFISYVLNRTNTLTGVPYKNDKAILAWQLGNELPSTDAWVTEMAAHVKSMDANHLLADGNYVFSQGIKTNSLNDANIDIIDPHIYKGEGDLVSKLTEWRNTTAGKKALIIGEFGNYSSAEVSQLLSMVQSNGTVGSLYWGTMFHHKMGGWHFPSPGNWSYLRYPGFASGDWAYETAIINALRSSAYGYKGLSVPAWPTPAAPLLFPSDSVHTLSWQGVSSAALYEVERAVSAAGPWATVSSGVKDDVTTPRHHTFAVPIFDDTTAAAGSFYYYRIRAKNPAGAYSPYSNVVGPVKSASVTIVDNGGPGYSESGTWTTSSLAGSYGGSSRYSNSAGSTATWTPVIPVPGYYNVYVRYPYSLSSATNAQYTVFHNGLTDTIEPIDQTNIANGWRLLTTAYFSGGGTEYVKLTAPGNGTNHYRADAVMFEPLAFGDGFQNNSSSNWTALSGSWSVVDDLSKVLKQTGTGVAETRGGAVYTDLSLTAAVKAYDKPAANASSGLVARASADFSDFYLYRINYDLNKLQLYKRVAGVFTQIGEANFTANPGSWNLLRLELKGNSIKGYVNGVQKISVTDSSLTSGYIGLRTVGQTAVFDNILVSEN
ncbi:family 16 glycoside hydrolase [Paenibacillus filicis]|uniref:mannan endo-1,4-beta-mannosidase n=1 Tax=Paenibacillus filicis TaxID=669464 RepID=A0ABU9DIV8_9BACL